MVTNVGRTELSRVSALISLSLAKPGGELSTLQQLFLCGLSSFLLVTSLCQGRYSSLQMAGQDPTLNNAEEGNLGSGQCVFLEACSAVCS